MWDTYIFGHLGIPHILCSSQLNPVKMDTFSAQFSPWDLLKIPEYSSTLSHHLQIASASSSCLYSGLSDRGQSWPLPQRLPGGPRRAHTKCWSGQRSCPCSLSRSKLASPENDYLYLCLQEIIREKQIYTVKVEMLGWHRMDHAIAQRSGAPVDVEHGVGTKEWHVTKVVTMTPTVARTFSERFQIQIWFVINGT